MQAGDIILFQGDVAISAGIKLATEGSFSHAAIAISDTEIVEALGDGVTRTAIADREDSRYAVYTVDSLTEEQRQALAAYAEAHIGEAYSYLQDVGFAVNYIREKLGFKRIPDLFAEHGKVICSALVDLAYRSIDIKLRGEKDAGDITPVGLSFSPLLHLIENHNLWEV